MSITKEFVPLWVRYFGRDKTRHAPFMLGKHGAGADALMCRDPEDLIATLREAMVRKYVVLDGHGPTRLPGIGSLSHSRATHLTPREIVKRTGPMKSCEVLILGACSQGNFLPEWQPLAPNAIVVGTPDIINDWKGASEIAQALRFMEARMGRVDEAEIVAALSIHHRYVSIGPTSPQLEFA